MVAGNREHFSSQGLYYPAAGMVGEAQHNLAWELSGDSRFTPEAGTVADLVVELARAQAPVALVSSEDLECLYSRTERLVELRQAVEGLGYSVCVVVTLRALVEYIGSLYGELLNHGLTVDVGTFVAAAVERRAVQHEGWDIPLDYGQLVAAFASVFGPSALRVLAYDPVDSVSPVLQAAGNGAPITPVPSWPRVNTGDRSFRAVLSTTEQRVIDATFGDAMTGLVSEFGPRP
jgi:hypothetical protein